MKRGGRKRLSEEAPSAEERQKQLRLNSIFSKQAVSQHTLDKLVTTFVVEGLHSFSIVEEKAFKDLVEHLAPGRKTLTRRMLTDRLDACFEDMKQKLSLEFINVDHVAVSADLWSSFHRCVLYRSGSSLEHYTARLLYCLAYCPVSIFICLLIFAGASLALLPCGWILALSRGKLPRWRSDVSSVTQRMISWQKCCLRYLQNTGSRVR